MFKATVTKPLGKENKHEKTLAQTSRNKKYPHPCSDSLNCTTPQENIFRTRLTNTL